VIWDARSVRGPRRLLYRLVRMRDSRTAVPWRHLLSCLFRPFVSVKCSSYVFDALCQSHRPRVSDELCVACGI